MNPTTLTKKTIPFASVSKFLLLVLILALFPFCESNGKEKASKRANPFLLRNAVKKELDRNPQGYIKIHFAMLAEVARGDIRAAIIWPAIGRGEIIDNDIIGFAFRKTENGWMPIKGNFDLGKGGQGLVKAMGGADYKIIKPNGVASSKMTKHIYNESQRFRGSFKQGKNQEAIAAFESLSRAFSFKFCCFDNCLAQWASSSIEAKSPLNTPMEITGFKKEKGRATGTLTMGAKGEKQSGKVSFVPVGSGWGLDTLEDK